MELYLHAICTLLCDMSYLERVSIWRFPSVCSVSPCNPTRGMAHIFKHYNRTYLLFSVSFCLGFSVLHETTFLRECKCSVHKNQKHYHIHMKLSKIFHFIVHLVTRTRYVFYRKILMCLHSHLPPLHMYYTLCLSTFLCGVHITNFLPKFNTLYPNF
jgi:hypothetical protein